MLESGDVWHLVNRLADDGEFSAPTEAGQGGGGGLFRGHRTDGGVLAGALRVERAEGGGDGGGELYGGAGRLGGGQPVYVAVRRARWADHAAPRGGGASERPVSRSVASEDGPRRSAIVADSANTGGDGPWRWGSCRSRGCGRFMSRP